MKTKRMSGLILSVIMLLSLLSQTWVFAESPTSGDWVYKLNEDQTTVTLTSYTGSDSEIVIPDTIDGKCVTAVGDGSKIFGEKASKINSVTLPQTVEKIGNNAFYNTNISSISFGKSLKEIGIGAFEYCENLKTVDFAQAENLETIKKEAFYNCTHLNSVDFSGATKLKTIGEGGFMQCRFLEKVDLSKTIVESIGKNAFNSCSVTPGKATTYPGLLSVKFSTTLKTIDEGAFESNYYLPEIEFPESLEYIGDGAFRNCMSLSGNLTIPKNVEYLGEGAFGMTCVSLNLDENKNYLYDDYGALYNAEKTLLLSVPCSVENFVVPDTVKRIGEYAFYSFDLSGESPSFSKISNVTLSDGLEEIGESAFWCCTELQEITFPKKLKSIECDAFRETQLSKVTIPASVSYLDVDAFDEYELTSVIYEGSKKHFEKILFTSGHGGNVNYEETMFDGLDMTYLCGTYTTIASDGAITCDVDDEYKPENVIIALYKGDSLVKVFPSEYSEVEKIIIYKPEVDYDSAKIMIWDGLESLKPDTGVEIVVLGQNG